MIVETDSEAGEGACGEPKEIYSLSPIMIDPGFNGEQNPSHRFTAPV